MKVKKENLQKENSVRNSKMYWEHDKEIDYPTEQRDQYKFHHKNKNKNFE